MYEQKITPNLNIEYTGGWCQLASEASTGQSGVYPSAYRAWLANVQHTDLPPKGFYVPVYLNMPNGPKDKYTGEQQDDVAWSCPDGTIAAAAQSGTHRGLFKYPSLQAYVADYAKYNGGATYRGWGEYVGRKQVVQLKEDDMAADNYTVESLALLTMGKSIKDLPKDAAAAVMNNVGLPINTVLENFRRYQSVKDRIFYADDYPRLKAAQDGAALDKLEKIKAILG